MTSKTETELRELIKSFKTGLELYTTSLTQDLLCSQTLDSPSDELVKLAQLLTAHATKVGIAFRPPVSIDAGYEQLVEASQKMLLVVSIVSQFDAERWSVLYQKEVISRVKVVIGAYIGLMDELESLDFKDKTQETEGRLISVGKVWESCKSVEELVKLGSVGLLKDQLKLSIGIVQDAHEELLEWIKEPFVEAEIVFGKDEFDEDREDEEVSPYTKQFADKWNNKVKMLKLLLNSLSKSLPESIDGVKIDEFNHEQKTLGASIDDLVCDIFLNLEKEALDENAVKLTKQSELLIKLVRSLNKDDDKKTQWLDLWLHKFVQ